MGILTSYPNIKIKGENFNFINGLYFSYQKLVELEKHGKLLKEVTSPFYGAETTNIDLFLSTCRQLIKEQLLQKEEQNIQCWGFKEIRYTPEDLSYSGNYDLVGYLDFLKLLFPKSAFIVQTRDFSEVINSAFWIKKDKSEIVEGLRAFDKEAKKWSFARNDTFWIDYKDLLEKNKKLEELHQFLGIAYSQAHINKVMSLEYSYNNKMKNNGDPKVIYSDSDLFIQAKLDDFILPRHYLNQSSPILISGIVLLKETIKRSGYVLLYSFDGNNQLYEVSWNIDSPFIRKENPNNQNSEKSRFNFQVSFCTELRLYIQEANDLNSENNKELVLTIIKSQKNS